MAKGLKYTMPFASIRDDVYTLNIYVEGYSGSATTLTGGSTPFVVSEAKEKEWLVPVRLQSGYFRVVCEEDDWRGLVATSQTSHLVELEDSSGNILWTGYVKPESFDHALYCGLDEYEIPVQCPLSVLDGLWLDWDDDYSLPTTGVLLYRLLSLVEDISWSNAYFPANVETETDDLAAEVNMSSFYEWKTAPIIGVGLIAEEYSLEPSASALEMLEAICTFWGWELHMEGRALYFAAHDELVNWRRVAVSDLATFDSSSTTTPYTASPDQLEQGTYMSNEHQVAITPAPSKIEVTSSSHRDKTIMDIDVDSIGLFGQWPSIFTQSNTTKTAEYTALNVPQSGVDILGKGVRMTYTGNDGSDSTSLAALTQIGCECVYHPVVRKYDQWEVSDEGTKTGYDPMTRLFLSFTPEIGGTTGYGQVKFESLSEWALNSCCIAISSDVKSNLALRCDTHYLEMMLTVGNYHWTGSAWASHGSEWRGTWFQVPVGSNSSSSTATKDACIVNSESYSTPYQGAKGYVIPITSAMRGKVTMWIRWKQYSYTDWLQIYGSLSTYTWRELDGLELSVVSAQNTLTNVKTEVSEEHTYDENISGGNGETHSVDLDLASWNYSEIGPGLLSYDDGSYMETISWADGSTSRPEVHLLSRLASLLEAPTEWRELDWADDDDHYTSVQERFYDDNGDGWAPVAFERNWAEGTVRVTLGRLP